MSIPNEIYADTALADAAYRGRATISVGADGISEQGETDRDAMLTRALRGVIVPRNEIPMIEERAGAGIAGTGPVQRHSAAENRMLHTRVDHTSNHGGETMLNKKDNLRPHIRKSVLSAAVAAFSSLPGTRLERLQVDLQVFRPASAQGSI